MNKKLLSTLLLVAMMASLAACGGEAAGGNDTTGGADTTAAPIDTDHDANGFLLDSIPADTDFGGAEFNLLVREAKAPTEFFVEEQTGDILNDAVFNSNRAVEERLNIVIEQTVQGAVEANNTGANLIMVNTWNPLPDDFTPDLVKWSDGALIGAECSDILEEMLDVCRAAGCHPIFKGTYRDIGAQKNLFNKILKEYRDKGYGDAYERTLKRCAIPGTSEHHLGLAFDITDSYYD